MTQLQAPPHVVGVREVPRLLNAREVPRYRVDGDPDRVRELLSDWQEPVVFEEGDTPAFRKLAEKWTNEYLAKVCGDNPVAVRHWRDGTFTHEGGQPEDLFQQMPMWQLLEHIEHCEGRPKYYSNVDIREAGHFAQPLFEDLRELSRDLTCLSAAEKVLSVFWVGAANNVTPLHHDDVARLHGMIRGKKLWVMFPPDLRHFRCLDVMPWRSGQRKHSRLGVGPLDPEKYPKLKRCSRTMTTLLAPGDFLYIPPCWWHHVSILDEMAISSSISWGGSNRRRLWTWWRLRLGNSLFGKNTM